MSHGLTGGVLYDKHSRGQLATLKSILCTGKFMARDQNTYAKRQREMEKRRKAEEKRARRRKKKEQANDDEANVADSPATEE